MKFFRDNYFINEVEMLVSTSSFMRIINLLQLKTSYYISRIFHRSLIWGKPFAASIEPTSVCNLKCPECPTGLNSLSRPRGTIALLHFEKILNNLGNQLWYLNLYLQGEPFLHPQFSELLKQSSIKNIYTMTSTNGHHITPSLAENLVKFRLNKLIISVDGLTQKTYERYRVNGDLDKVITGIQHIVNAKKTANSKKPLLVMQFLAFKHNEHEISDARNVGKSLGFNKVEIKKAQFYSLIDQKNIHPPIQHQYSRYTNSTLKGKAYNHCWRQWSSVVVTWQGVVAPCCFDKDTVHSFGNIIHQPIKSILNDKNAIHFKNTILQNRNTIDICSNCPEGRTLL